MSLNNSYVYISGPYRGSSTHDSAGYAEISQNILNARLVAMKLARVGIPYFCPHLNSAHFELYTPEVPSSYWLNLDLILLRHSSACLVLPRWKESEGAKIEVDECHRLTIPVFASVDKLQLFWNEVAGGEESSPLSEEDPRQREHQLNLFSHLDEQEEFHSSGLHSVSFH